MGLTQTANTSQASKVVCQFVAALFYTVITMINGLQDMGSVPMPCVCVCVIGSTSVSVSVSAHFRVSKSAALQLYQRSRRAERAVCALAQELICVSASQKFMNDSPKPVQVATHHITSTSQPHPHPHICIRSNYYLFEFVNVEASSIWLSVCAALSIS